MVFLATNRTNFHEWGAALSDTEQHMPAGLWLRKRDARTTFQKFQSKRRLILFVFIRKVVVSMPHAVTSEHEGLIRFPSGSRCLKFRKANACKRDRTSGSSAGVCLESSHFAPRLFDGKPKKRALRTGRVFLVGGKPMWLAVSGRKVRRRVVR